MSFLMILTRGMPTASRIGKEIIFNEDQVEHSSIELDALHARSDV